MPQPKKRQIVAFFDFLQTKSHSIKFFSDYFTLINGTNCRSNFTCSVAGIPFMWEALG